MCVVGRCVLEPTEGGEVGTLISSRSQYWGSCRWGEKAGLRWWSRSGGRPETANDRDREPEGDEQCLCIMPRAKTFVSAPFCLYFTSFTSDGSIHHESGNTLHTALYDSYLSLLAFWRTARCGSMLTKSMPNDQERHAGLGLEVAGVMRSL